MDVLTYLQLLTISLYNWGKLFYKYCTLIILIAVIKGLRRKKSVHLITFDAERLTDPNIWNLEKQHMFIKITYLTTPVF